jgi:2-polyprenyl-3-methyl-5-hydroxy-6-metoxy-1,4-benzoquinol methylase
MRFCRPWAGKENGNIMDDRRLINEIQHGRFLAIRGAGEVWNWETPAGRLRWARRVKMLTCHLREGMEVLELGCGTGYFTREIAKTGARLTAIDISPELIEIARHELKDVPGVAFSIQNAYEMNFADERFEAVVGSSILHHLDVASALGECFRVLKPGGTISFTEPNMLNPQIALQKNIPFLKKKLGDSPDETAFFAWGIKNRAASAGFVDVRVRCFDFLHPAIPERLLPVLIPVAALLEKVPLVANIAGSLHIRAVKPQKR